MKKKILLISSFTLLSISIAFGQKQIWSNSNNIPQDNLIERNTFPKESHIFKLDLTSFKNSLSEINNTSKTVIITFPNSKGELTKFKISERSFLSNELQAKYTSIRSYVGKSLDGKSSIRFSFSNVDGLSAMIFNPNHSFDYIDAYSKDLETYIVYNRKNVENLDRDFKCNTLSGDEQASTSINPSSSNRTEIINDGKLRTYKLALASTYEYSRYHYSRVGLNNGTDLQKKEAVLSAMNVAMTRVNGIYETELGITMVLIPNNDQLIYLTSSDPYTNSDGDELLHENQANVDAVIGFNNYDIGHVFSTGGGGVAWLKSPCKTSLDFQNGNYYGKASGVTGRPAPINDAFYVDYVAHEIGHQFGATHTFNNFCGQNRTSITAVEPGSGSTIMGYAGICDPNIQNNSDPYFHSISIQNIHNFITNEGSCSVDTNSSNNAPVATLTQNLYYIPHSTAFKLEGSGTDVDNDNLTYTWEQMNNQITTQPPLSTNPYGPTFRSISPSENPYRYFPNLTEILNDRIVYTSNPTPFKWEVIPSTGRLISFNFLVRDNNIFGGQTDKKTLTLFTQAAAGPFKVTSQSENETWTTGQQVTITWDVAGTTANNINTANVKILISIDGGLTWNYTLTESTPNNGTYNFTVPSGIGETTNARLMIVPVDNVYLAVNKTNFTINSPLAVIDQKDVEAISIYPNPSNGVVTVGTSKNYNNLIVLVNDMTGKQVFNYNSAQSNIKAHKLNLNQLPNGVYIINVKADGEQYTKKLVIKK